MYVLCNLCTEMPKNDMLHPESMIQSLPLYDASKSAYDASEGQAT